MEPLEYNQKHLELLGFCQSDGSRIITLIKRIGMLWMAIGMDLIPTTHFLYSHFDNNTEFLISTLTPIIAYIVVSVSYLSFCIEGNRAIQTITYLRALVKERTSSFRFMLETIHLIVLFYRNSIRTGFQVCRR